MALLKRNKFKVPRHHFSPGGWPVPHKSIDARQYASECKEARLIPVAAKTQLTTRAFPLQRTRMDMSAAITQGGKQLHQFPAPFVLALPKGRVLGSEATILTRENELLSDTAVMWCHPLNDHRIFRHVSLPEIVRLNERVAVIGSEDPHVYFHWMVNILPRLGLLSASGESYDRIYLGPLTERYQFETLRRLGIDLNEIIMGTRSAQIEAAELIVPSLPAKPCDFPPFAIDFLRKTFPTSATRQDRRLYISRNGAKTRHLLNEAEIVAVLKRRGFEAVILESLSVAEQAELFASAEVIVAPHGASLTNIAFCEPHALLVEIFHPDHVCDCYWQASHHLGLRHEVISAKRAYRNLAKRINDRNRDGILDVAHLESVLDRLL